MTENKISCSQGEECTYRCIWTRFHVFFRLTFLRDMIPSYSRWNNW